MNRITASEVTAPARVLYPLGSLSFAADGTYAFTHTLVPATLYRVAGQGIFVKVDASTRNDDTYRVLPTDIFDAA